MYHNFKLRLLKFRKKKLRNHYKIVFSKKNLVPNKKIFIKVGAIKSTKIFLDFKNLGNIFFKGSKITKGVENKLFKTFLNSKIF
jgi:hypothetical protein